MTEPWYTCIEEPAISRYTYIPDEAVATISIAISLKRIADALSVDDKTGNVFLNHLHGVLADASHDHALRMSR